MRIRTSLPLTRLFGQTTYLACLQVVILRSGQDVGDNGFSAISKVGILMRALVELLDDYSAVERSAALIGQRKLT